VFEGEGRAGEHWKEGREHGREGDGEMADGKRKEAREAYTLLLLLLLPSLCC
jgi:hypothetical protein